jgi:hypothetical protein
VAPLAEAPLWVALAIPQGALILGAPGGRYLPACAHFIM